MAILNEMGRGARAMTIGRDRAVPAGCLSGGGGGGGGGNAFDLALVRLQLVDCTRIGMGRKMLVKSMMI